MLVKTRAILFKTHKYSENSVIARFYTEEFGLESFIINNIRSKKAAINAAHLQPLNLLETDIYQRNNANLQRIKELRCQPTLHNVYTDFAKTSVIIFMQEVLNKVIVEKEKNPEMFDFLFNNICWLDASEKLPAIYPVYWLLQLSRPLGFFPETDSWTENSMFLPNHGVFTHEKTEPVFFSTESAVCIHQLCGASLGNFAAINPPAVLRRQLLEQILFYYRIHIEGFNELKSHKVLAEVLA